MPCNSACILNAESDGHNLLVKTEIIVSEKSTVVAMDEVAYLESNDVPKPFGGLVGPLVIEPLIFKLEYAKVVYDSPNPNSNLGATFALTRMSENVHATYRRNSQNRSAYNR